MGSKNSYHYLDLASLQSPLISIPEEAFFRGFIQRRLYESLGKKFPCSFWKYLRNICIFYFNPPYLGYKPTFFMLGLFYKHYLWHHLSDDRIDRSEHLLPLRLKCHPFFTILLSRLTNSPYVNRMVALGSDTELDSKISFGAQ